MTDKTGVFLRRMAAMREDFKRNLHERLDAMQAASDQLMLETLDPLTNQQALQTLYGLSHKLKGAAATFGFTQLADQADTAENLAENWLNNIETIDVEEQKKLIVTVRELAKVGLEDRSTSSLNTLVWDRLIRVEDLSEEKQKTILLVDDDSEFREILHDQISHFGFRVESIADHHDLEDAIQTHQPDVLILDVIFPGKMDAGVTTARSLREKGILSCPTIFMSIRSDLEARLGAVRAGGEGYLVKPIVLPDLIRMLDSVSQRVAPEPFRVLIVDDDASVADNNAAILNKVSISTVVVTDPFSIMAPLRELRPDVILMDVKMPECDGFELARVIRQDNEFLQTPIIFLTSGSLKSTWLEAIAVGGDDFIKKGITDDELISSVLGRARRSRDLGTLVTRFGESENRFRAVTDSANDVILTVDDQGRIVYWNRGGQLHFGYDESEILGTPVGRLIPGIGLQIEALTKLSNEDLRPDGKFNKTIEAIGKHKNGTEFLVEMSLAEWKIGRRAFVTGIVRNITDRKRAQNLLADSERRFRDLAELSSDWFWETDSQNRFTYFSRSAFAGTRMTASDLIGKTRFDLAKETETDEEFWRAHKADLDAHRPFRNLRYRMTRGDNTYGWVNVSGMPFYNESGELVGYRGSTSDITDEVEAENRLRLAIEEAEDANKSKSLFLSSVSHELRTPLNAILGFGQLLAEDTRHSLEDKQLRFVNQILKSGSHLLDLIDQILDLSKIEVGTLVVNQDVFTVADVVEECIAIAETLGGEQGISVSVDPLYSALPPVVADQIRTKQVLLNLLSNAIKYNKPNGRVAVTVVLQDDVIEFSIADTGAGIPEEYFGDLFQPFSRLPINSEDAEGSGIGLALSKRLVERMSGTIGLFNNDDGGATFWFRLPLSDRPGMVRNAVEEQKGESMPEANDTSPGQILYIEDNPANLELMAEIIQRISGFELVSAHTAEIGLVIARDTKPCLIFMDINLPGMDGYAALEALRVDDRTREIPVIALSANAMPSDIEKGNAAGFDRYMTKPIQVAAVSEAIKQVVDQIS